MKNIKFLLNLESHLEKRNSIKNFRIFNSIETRAPLYSWILYLGNKLNFGYKNVSMGLDIFDELCNISNEADTNNNNKMINITEENARVYLLMCVDICLRINVVGIEEKPMLEKYINQFKNELYTVKKLQIIRSNILLAIDGNIIRPSIYLFNVLTDKNNVILKKFSSIIWIIPNLKNYKNSIVSQTIRYILGYSDDVSEYTSLERDSISTHLPKRVEIPMMEFSSGEVSRVCNIILKYMDILSKSPYPNIKSISNEINTHIIKECPKIDFQRNQLIFDTGSTSSNNLSSWFNNEKETLNHNEKHKISYNTYKKGKILGGGTFATTRQIISPKKSHTYAVKEYHDDTEVINEIACLSLLNITCFSSIKKELDLINTCNIVGLEEFIINKNEYFLIFEYGIYSLEHLLKTNGMENNKQKVKCIEDIINAVELCHYNDLIHGDIKPANIVLFNNEVYKLIDFGSSIALSSTYDTLRLDIGTPLYAAPEILLGSTKYDNSIDIWSFGLLCYIIAIGYNIFYIRAENDSKIQDELDILNMWFELCGTPTKEYKNRAGISSDDDIFLRLRSYERWIDYTRKYKKYKTYKFNRVYQEDVLGNYYELVFSCLKIDPYLRTTSENLKGCFSILKPLLLNTKD